LIPISTADFARRAKGTLHGVAENAEITGFALDNREVRQGDLFVAIKGSRVDGHDFATTAIAQGAVAALCERQIEGPHVLVPSVVQALADYASSVREGFSGPVIAITGSAGKTTTKEFTAAALSPLGDVLKSEGNRNSEFSSPLVWAELTPQHKAVVIEMGMRGFGQIRHLASFTKPTIGVVTNIGYSHVELVGSREGVASAKSELLEALPADGLAVILAEDEFLPQLRSASGAPVKTFGFSTAADCRVSNYKVQGWRSSEVMVYFQGQAAKIVLPAIGRHIAVNAACAVLVACASGVELSQAAEAIAKAKLPPMRMEIIENNGVTILLDTYNASPTSVIAALETLSDVPVEGQRVAVIGDMRELGAHAEEGHREVGAALARLRYQRVLVIGQDAHWIAEEARENGLANITQVNRLEDISAFLKSLSKGDAVLVKGSRALELERALEFMKEPAH
jgi:UDP-N-acetylmuramoyl-tripeptide--D-alanyl-D-alanine ligase